MVFDWGSVVGAGISAIGNLAGGVMSQQGQSSANAANLAFANQQFQWQKEQAARNEQLQREFAQNSVRWRVEDAKAAGLHPIFAMGGGGASFSPTSFMPGDSGQQNENAGLAAGLSGVGQDIGRAIKATQTKQERVDDAMRLLQIRKLEGEVNESDARVRLINSQIAKQTAQVGPPLPDARGPGNVVQQGAGMGAYEDKPPEVGTQAPGLPQNISGPPVPYVQYMHTGTGLSMQPAPGVKAEDEFGAPLMGKFLLDTYGGAVFGSTTFKPSQELLRRYFPGAVDWTFNTRASEWRPVYRGSDRRWHSVPGPASLDMVAP